MKILDWRWCGVNPNVVDEFVYSDVVQLVLLAVCYRAETATRCRSRGDVLEVAMMCCLWRQSLARAPTPWGRRRISALLSADATLVLEHAVRSRAAVRPRPSVSVVLVTPHVAVARRCRHLRSGCLLRRCRFFSRAVGAAIRRSASTFRASARSLLFRRGWLDACDEAALAVAVVFAADPA